VTDREQYTPGPASGAEVRKDGERWTLIQAPTDPAPLSEWAPFDDGGSARAARPPGQPGGPPRGESL